MRYFADISGKKFAMLTIIRFDHKDWQGRYKWLCRCDCGNLTLAIANQLASGRKKSCGCLKRTAGGRPPIHGEYKTRLWKKWKDLMSWSRACKSPVSDEWATYSEFKTSVYKSFQLHASKFGEGRTRLHRYDSSDEFSSENCYWKTGNKITPIRAGI